MVKLPRPFTDQALITLAWSWVDVLAEGDYEKVFQEIGFAMAYQYDGGGAQAIERAIEEYRDPVYLPNETVFKVTDRRTAKGGNPEQDGLHISRYVPISWLLAEVIINLPLNGKWSRLQMTFVVGADPNEQNTAVLSLEDLWYPRDREQDPGWFDPPSS